MVPSRELSPRQYRLLGVALFIGALALYAPSLGHEFVTLDDPTVVVANEYVRDGFSAEGVRRALLGGFEWNWHPLTWLSHMLDGQIYGLVPAGHHLTNLLLHAANVVLLFHVLSRLTKSVGQSALVALLFAVHPAHVEAVAWVSTRRDLLSTLFALLTVLAYVRHAERPTRGRYAALALLYACGLLSKSMLVTLPILLLLFDYWPLARLSYRSVMEKVPLVVLAVAVGLITIIEQRSLGAFKQLEHLSLWTRLTNAVVSYVEYLRMLVWPVDLGVMYPHPEAAAGTPLTVARIVAATLVLVGLSLLVVRSKRRYALVGWLWWLLSAAPVIGVLQVGPQARADRYTYLTYIGLYILIVWTGAALLASQRARVVALTCTAAVVLALSVRTRDQLGTWESSAALYRQAIDVDPDNVPMRFALAKALDMNGNFEDAERHLRICLAADPYYADMHDRLGVVLASQGRLREALVEFQIAVRLNGQSSKLRYNLAFGLHQSGDDRAACAELRELVAIDPAHSNARRMLLESCQQP